MKKVPQQIRRFVAEQVSRLLGSQIEVSLTQSSERSASFAVSGKGRANSSVVVEWQLPEEGRVAAKLIIQGGIHHAMTFCPEVASRVEAFLNGFGVPASLVLTHERAVVELTEEPLPFARRQAA